MTCFGHWYNPKYPETSARCVSHLSSKQFAAKWKNRFFPWTFFALKTKGFQIVKGMWKRRIQRHGIQTWYASVSCQQSAPRDSSRSNEMTAKWLRWFFVGCGSCFDMTTCETTFQTVSPYESLTGWIHKKIASFVHHTAASPVVNSYCWTF